MKRLTAAAAIVMVVAACNLGAQGTSRSAGVIPVTPPPKQPRDSAVVARAHRSGNTFAAPTPVKRKGVATKSSVDTMKVPAPAAPKKVKARRPD